ncbi:MAG: hypothetical protein U1U88_001785 [Lawsonella clevelandensis]
MPELRVCPSLSCVTCPTPPSGGYSASGYTEADKPRWAIRTSPTSPGFSLIGMAKGPSPSPEVPPCDATTSS